MEFQPIKSGFLEIFHRPDNFHDTAENKSSEKSSEKGSEKGREKSREKILNLIINRPEITINELAKELDMSTAGIEKNLANLKKAEEIKRIGQDKGGHWEIMKKTGNN